MQGIQLLNLHEMLNHYEKDLKNNTLKIDNFNDFLDEHYANVIDLEVDGHKKLPFKSELPINIQLAIHNYTLDFIQIQNFIFLKEKLNFAKTFAFSDFRLKGIWNPPRF